jgi:hypothetical protein
MAKLARRKPAPVYAERVYDTVSRATPTALERVLYAKVGPTCCQAENIIPHVLAANSAGSFE